MAGLGNLSTNLVGLATAHHPAVPPRGERAVIIIAIAELTDHLQASEYPRGVARVKQVTVSAAAAVLKHDPPQIHLTFVIGHFSFIHLKNAQVALRARPMESC